MFVRPAVRPATFYAMYFFYSRRFGYKIWYEYAHYSIMGAISHFPVRQTFRELAATDGSQYYCSTFYIRR